jgi:signal peptidase I
MGRRLILALVVFGGLIVAAVVAFTLLGGLYRAPSESMVPTIQVGDRFAVLDIATPEVGDIVVFHPPAGAESGGDEMCGSAPPEGQMCAEPTGERVEVRFVKRIVAAGGDRISMRDGKIVRNGKPETTNGPQACEQSDGCDFQRELTVPKGHFFVLGDNRGASDDSRFWGPVPEDWVIGRYWFAVG